jgi:hypothetical protein
MVLNSKNLEQALLAVIGPCCEAYGSFRQGRNPYTTLATSLRVSLRLYENPKYVYC